MVFSSMVFLCVFLPVVFLLYLCMPGLRAKNIFLMLASVLFYAYGEPVYVVLLLASTWINYGFGRWIGGAKGRGKKILLAFDVILNLGLLVVFKYTDMFFGTVNLVFHSGIPLPGIALPIGISFFTFQAMSYVIDVYRGETMPQRKYQNVLLYISFFPQLIAGPIVKYHDIEKQISERQTNLQEISIGLRRFILGLSKKVLISNTMSVMADAVFSVEVGSLSGAAAWLGAVSYMLQIYFDFSGYSDMAIGLGHMFGFTFEENFKYPYCAVTIKEFWRRWHISLSSWFKDYLYIPLGGNRKGKGRTAFNKLVVFFCTGIWHGASWTFVVWGLFHGFFSMLEEYAPFKKLPRLLGHVYTLLVVCIGFVIFRADTVGTAFQMIGVMFGGWGASGNGLVFVWNLLSSRFIFYFLLALVLSFPVLEKIRKIPLAETKAVRAASYGGSLVLLVLCILSLASGTNNPFIYFRF